MHLIGLLRADVDNLQGLLPVRLCLAVLCCLLLTGLALVNTTAVHTIHTTVQIQTAQTHDTTIKSNASVDSPNCHTTKSPILTHSPDHHADLAAACCAWLCSAHALLPAALTAISPPIEHIRADPFNLTRLQNPQLAHGRLIERPPRLTT